MHLSALPKGRTQRGGESIDWQRRRLANVGIGKRGDERASPAERPVPGSAWHSPGERE